MRLFVGFFVTIEGYDRLQSTIEVPGPSRWVEEANLHLTLQFLGEVQDTAELCSRLSEVRYPRNHRVRFERLASFDEKLLYASCEDRELLRLAEEVQNRLAGAFEREKPFIPHVTLLRARGVRGYPKRLPEGVKIYATLKLCLIESVQEAGRVRYRLRKEW